MLSYVRKKKPRASRRTMATIGLRNSPSWNWHFLLEHWAKSEKLTWHLGKSYASCERPQRKPARWRDYLMLPDFGHGTRLAASLNGEKKVFSFSPRWSEDEARRIQQPTNRVMTQQPKVTGRCTDSGPSTFLMSPKPKAKNSQP